MADAPQAAGSGVVGAGLIGRARAAVSARAGWTVRLFDPHGPTLDAAPGLIREELEALHAHGLADDPAGAAARVGAAGGLAEAVAGAGFVQENGPETAEAKQALFAELDRLSRPGRGGATSVWRRSWRTSGGSGRKP